MKKHLLAIKFLPFAVAITFLSGLVFVVMQQDLRTSANEPQIGMAQEIVAELAWGNPDTLLSYGKSNPHLSTSAFVNIYDDGGRPLSSGVYGSDLPALPQGVLDYTRVHGSDVFTWQPMRGLRIAAVIYRYTGAYQGESSGFVLAGRSLREVERQESSLLKEVFATWLVAMFAVFASCWLQERYTR